ncbi:Stp1/IreP family PP2C-type Ser/Thr phosphatase [Eubacteriales bacterium OttesenSCG-928-N13]|nr:Stp1/IreP family PP2C-type Ser/Thr phosphatase [Eubacteriales bacterium OttesenSCG-928-N13]
MRAYALTHVGNVRSANEDAFYLPLPGEQFAAVADGMGGHLAGEVASGMAIRAFTEFLRNHTVNEETLHSAVTSANAEIHQAARRDPLKHGMGTTLTALYLQEDTAYLTHVGDSRAYLLRKKALMQLSNDHSLVNELVEKGELSPLEAATHPQRNIITRALGTNKKVEPDIIRLDYQAGDVWLLCTDGLSNYLRTPEIAEILLQSGTWNDKLQSMVQLALNRGGSDNITALIALGEGDDHA